MFLSFVAFAVKKLWIKNTSGESKIPNPEGFEQMCSSFHLFMCDESLCEEFNIIIKKFNADISADLVNKLLTDLLMELLSKLIWNRLCSTKPTELSMEAPLSKLEEQITRYIAGFVGNEPWKSTLLAISSKRPSPDFLKTLWHNLLCK